MLKIQDFNKIIVANWKLNGSLSFVEKYLEKIQFNHNKNRKNCLVICPPAPFLQRIYSKNFLIGAQDCSAYNEGAFTGEISAKILKDIGCKICIIGHSERRVLFEDNLETIGKKLSNCLENKILPILCIGENLEQKKENLTKDIIRDQLVKSIPSEADNKKIIIAYEPLWAIGSGLIPKLEEISAIHMFIKNNILQDRHYKILYGGSVKASNYKDILNLEGVDGLLVGGASINIDEFNQIIEF